MNNSLARFREAGSFIAGLLIALAIVVPVFAMMVADPGGWQTLRLFGPRVILTPGFALQVVVTTTKPERRRKADPEFNGGLRDEFLNGEQVCLDGGCQAEHRELAAGLQSSRPRSSLGHLTPNEFVVQG